MVLNVRPDFYAFQYSSLKKVTLITVNIWGVEDVFEKRTALFTTRRIAVISYRRFGTTCRVPYSGVNNSLLLTPEVETDRIPSNFGTKLLLLAEWYPKRGQFSSTSRRKPEITHEDVIFLGGGGLPPPKKKLVYITHFCSKIQCTFSV